MELDFKSIRALSSSTRLEILRHVLENEATPTELSRSLDKSKSTISSHLEKLQDAGLVEKDSREGRKRVVYRPTDKSDAIVRGRERKVKFSVLSSGLAVIAAVLTGSRYLDPGSQEMSTAMSHAQQSGPETALLAATAGFLGIAAAALFYGLAIRKLG